MAFTKTRRRAAAPPLSGDLGADGPAVPRKTAVDAARFDPGNGLRGQRRMAVSPIWTLDLDAALRATAFEYAHHVAMVDCGAVAGVMDPFSSVRRCGFAGDGGASARYGLKDRLSAMKSRIPQGWVLKGKKATQKRNMRPISYRRLVDAVCVEEASLSAVLREHDWSGRSEYRVALRAGLQEALAAMASGRLGGAG